MGRQATRCRVGRTDIIQACSPARERADRAVRSLCCGQQHTERECVIASPNDNDDGGQGAQAPEPFHTDFGADEDEAWEGFALDATVFRSGGHKEE